MQTYDTAPRRHYEEALRAMGGVLDEQRVEDALLVETRAGFVVTGMRRGHIVGRHPHGYELAESTFRDLDVLAASERGRGRRASGSRAGRYEEALRLIGRRVDNEKGSLVLLLDQGDGFLLRMLCAAARQLAHRFETFRAPELQGLRDEAMEARIGT